MEQLTSNVYVQTGGPGCNFGYVTTRDGVVMIESPLVPETAVRVRSEIAAHGTVRYLINTEPHLDHFGTNALFEGTVVAHEGTRDSIMGMTVDRFQEMLARSAPTAPPLPKDYKFKAPSVTLSQRLTIYLGEHTFQLINMPGHTPYQVAVFIPEEKVVFTSDNIFHEEMPFLHQAVPYAWLDALKQLEKLEADYYVPGHGKVCDKSYLPRMSATVQLWMDTVIDAIDKGLTLEEAQKTITLWKQYPQSSPPERMMMVQGNSIANLYRVLKPVG